MHERCAVPKFERTTRELQQSSFTSFNSKELVACNVQVNYNEGFGGYSDRDLGPGHLFIIAWDSMGSNRNNFLWSGGYIVAKTWGEKNLYTVCRGLYVLIHSCIHIS